MKNKFFKFISLMLSIIILVAVTPVFSVSAQTDTKLFGDINRDGKIYSDDALLALQNSVGKIKFNFGEENLAKVTGGSSVTASDALAILQRSIDLIKTFTVGDNCDNLYDVKPSVIENEAYMDDDSADTSFVIDETGLQQNTIYILQFNTIYGKDDWFIKDDYRLIFAFQGLLNRDFGRDAEHTSLIYVLPFDSTNNKWLNYVTAAGSVMNGMKKVSIRTFEDFLDTFANQLRQCGVVLWDWEVPATANVALTICGVDGYLPVMVDSDIQEYMSIYDVPIKLDLSGKFTGEGLIPDTNISSSGSAKNDAYLWALEKYFDRCSSKYLAYTLDGAPCVKGEKFATLSNSGSNCIENHDYIVARRCFVFDLDPYKYDFACDDDCGIRGLDNETMLKIFERRFQRANGEFGQLLGFPPWWLKYTKFENMGSQEAVYIEWLFTEYISCYNMAKEADAIAPPSMTNGSFYYKYRALTKEFKNTRPTVTEKYDPSVHYYTIYMGDYDSSAWMKKYVVDYWMSALSDHGQIPFMWCYNPNLSNRVPMAFDYVYSKKTDLDFFEAGDSGAGYVIPSGLTYDNYLAYTRFPRPEENGDALQKWADYCQKYYKLFDMDITGFIINGANALSSNILNCYSQFAPVGNFGNHKIGDGIAICNGTPYVYLYNGINVNQYDTMYSYMFNSMGKYNFGGYRTVCLSPGNIKSIVSGYEQYCTGKGKKVKYVDPYTYFNLLKQSGQGEILE